MQNAWKFFAKIWHPREPNTCQPDGPDSDLSIKAFPTEASDGQDSNLHEICRCNDLERILCELKADFNTIIAKPRRLN